MTVGYRDTDPDTSVGGYRDVAVRAGNQRHRLLREYAVQPAGLTAYEAGTLAGLTGGSTCYWKRVSELHHAGHLTVVTDSDGAPVTRRNPQSGSAQQVLTITDDGYRALANA